MQIGSRLDLKPLFTHFLSSKLHYNHTVIIQLLKLFVINGKHGGHYVQMNSVEQFTCN